MTKQYISKEEEYALIRAWQDQRDEKARSALIVAHDHYCRKVANGFMEKKHGLLPDDLHQQARIGLLIAIDKFDLHSDCRLLTYAGSFIRGEILQHIDYAGYTVRLSVPTQRDIKVINTQKEQYFSQVGHYPGLGELAVLSHMKLAKLFDLLAVPTGNLSLNAEQSSLEEGGDSFIGTMADEETPRPEETAEFKEFMKKLSPAISQLDENEQALIQMHYLFDDDTPATYEQMAVFLGVTKSTARKQEIRALKKLAHILTPEFT